MILFGYVVKVKFSEVERAALKKGNLVVLGDTVASVVDDPFHLQLIPSSERRVLEEAELLLLEKLMVKIEDGHGKLHYFPLKFGQWRHVLHEKLVDSETKIPCTILESTLNWNTGITSSTRFAQIVYKNNQFRYSEKDAKTLCLKAIHDILSYVHLNGAIVQLPDDYFTSWWTANKVLLPDETPNHN